MAETHPQLQPALLRLSAIISQYFTVPLQVTIHRFESSNFEVEYLTNKVIDI
jgi:hypothetical protein